MQLRPLIFFLTAAALAGCAKPPAPVAPPPPALPPHLGPPPAAACNVSPFHVANGETGKVSISMSSDGGYCAAVLTADDGKPFDAPLLHVVPTHGSVRVVKYNGHTSIEYAPTPGYAGTDSFEVRLIEKGTTGYTTLDVTVTIGR